MSLLKDATEEKKFDIRSVEKNIMRNMITDAEFKKTTEVLPDDAENAEYVAIETLSDQDDA